MEKLIVIISGPEHNGTTYFKRLLESIPNVYSGFETGFLLNENFENCLPWNEWIYRSDEHWGVRKEINFNDENLSFDDKYRLLFENKGSGCGTIQKLIKESEFLIDKTPKYFYKLPTVIKNLNNNDIPIFIVLKNLNQHYISLCVKRNVSLRMFKKKINNCIKILEWIKNNPNYNVHIFEYDDLVEYDFSEFIKTKINIKFDGNILYDNFLKKIPDNTNFKDKFWKKNEKEIIFPEELNELSSYDLLLNALKKRNIS